MNLERLVYILCLLLLDLDRMAASVFTLLSSQHNKDMHTTPVIGRYDRHNPFVGLVIP